MIKISVLVCLFNKKIEESETIQSLLSANIDMMNVTVYLWDNSAKSIDEDSFLHLRSNFKNLIYKHTPENLSLSKIYNNVIDTLKTDESYLMLCDDDSKIPQDFFEKLNYAIKNSPLINLFLPQIISDSVLISPAKNYLIYTKYFTHLSPGLLKSKFVTGINSGMVVSNRVFKDGFRYDEKLKFYGTDIYFMHQYSDKYKSLIVLDAKIPHSLSFHSSTDIDNKLRIFKENTKTIGVIYKNHFFKRNLVLFNNWIVALKFSFKYKCFDFLLKRSSKK